MAGVYNLYIPVCALITAIICNIVFFSKERAQNKETAIFSRVLIYSLVDSVLLVIIICLALFNKNSIELMKFLNKVDYAMYILFSSNLFLYVYYVTSKEEKEQKVKLYNFFFYLTTVIDIILMILLLFMNVDVHIEGNAMYSDGMALTSTIVGCAFYFLSIVVCLIINFKKAVTKKLTPLYVLIFFFILVFVLNQVDKTIVIISMVLAYVNLIMLFTIENPDVKMARALEVAREQAEKANRAKTDFLSSMSHEIRTPLNAIVGFSDCIQDATTLEEAKENAHDIVNASQTLLEIVNGILDISKIEAGKVEIVNSPYNAKEVFENLAILITPKMNEKGLDFTYSIAPDLPQTLYGDHANIKKIVTNLLSNAAKYTEHGFVRYEVHCVNSGKYSKLIITVEDSGRGIKKDSVDKLFTKFQRLDEDKNTTIEGTGLGMAITKQLIELMGGKILIHTIYGEGSKFTVVINQRIEEEEQVEKHHQLDTLDLKDVKLLLVDDNALNIKVATKILEKYNANMVTSVTNGFDCLDKVKNGEKYDVILLDDMMPKMSGVETLNELKKIPGFNTPVIALTANAITGMKEKYLNEGFNGYLGKPIEKDQLIKVMNEILGRNITNNIPVNEIKEEVKNTEPVEEKKEVVENKEEIDDKNRIVEVSADDEDLLKNQQLVSETTKIDIPEDKLDDVNDHIEEVLEIEEQPKEVIETTDEPELLDIEEKEIDIPQVEEPPKIEPEEYLKSHGINLEQALENLGDMEMYNATVEDFISEVEEKWQRIEDYKLQNNLKDYSIEVHSLKSDAKYLGLVRLADIAYQHELASKENNSDYVNANFNYLEEEYQKALEIIKNYKENFIN